MGREVYFNSFTSNSRGVCILISTSVAYKVIRSRKDNMGNMLILDLELEGKRFTLVDIYGPNEDSPGFFLKIQEIIDEHVIICGDFNLVQNQELDTYNYINVNNPNAKESVVNLKEELNLIDPFREIYENSKQYTRRKQNPRGEHSAILLTFIKLPFPIKTFVLSIFKWPLKAGFTRKKTFIQSSRPVTTCLKGFTYITEISLKLASFWKHITGRIYGSFSHLWLDILICKITDQFQGSYRQVSVN